ncbi:MAG: T9SS type A sorting domain-containing protein [Candidatus Cloacimonetes bacterium]|nr:T9SS type A sorting domain-containing protein [Candidatus Cloacimonadota bacterium]
MKTKKLVIALLISLFVISFAWAKDEASISKSNITNVERAENAKVEKGETEKVETPSLSNKGGVAVEKKEAVVEPIQLPNTSAKGTKAEVIHIDKEQELHDSTTIVSLKEIGSRQIGDNCATPIPVTLPADLPYGDYLQTTCGRDYNYDATCLGIYDEGEDIIYEVTVISEVTVDITMDPLVFSDLLGTGLAIDDVCPPGEPCLAYDTGPLGIRYLNAVALVPGTYYIMVDSGPPEWMHCIEHFNLTIEETCVECPGWGIPEGEPCLVDGDVDNFNGGCNSVPPVFSTISCGETICGTASTFITGVLTYRDTDWYQVVLNEQCELTWTAIAEFELLIFILDAGSEDCLDFVLLGWDTGMPCEEVTVSATVTPGAYWLWIGPSVFTGYPCTGGNNDYVATLTCEPIAPETSLSLPEYTEGCPGQAVSIPVYLDNPDTWEVEGIDMTITFDETVLDATGGTLGAVLADLGYGLFVNTYVDGEVTVVIYAMTDLFNDSGDIIFLEFNVVGVEEDDTDLVFDFGEVNETPVALFDGFFDVIPCLFDISGFIGYYDGLAPVPNADVNITSDTTYVATTDGVGEYLFLDIPGGNYESTSSKDTDLGGLSGMDASRIARYAADLYSFGCLEIIAADVSMNGYISGMDASRVARYAAGLITELNGDGIDWVFTPEPIPNCTGWPPIVYENTLEYYPLDSYLTDEDFIGIRLGDVSGNWSPDARMPLTQKSSPPGADPSEKATEIEAIINSTLRIPVVIEEVTAIEGIDIFIEFDNEVLTLKGLTLNDGILAENDYAVESNLKEGRFVIYAQRELVSDAGTVAFIEFDVIGKSGTKTDVYFIKFDVNETEATGGFSVLDSEDSETISRRLEVNVIQTIPEKFALYPNYPNPFSTNTLIRYDLPEVVHVIIQIYNVKGQLVKELVNVIEEAGRKQIEWNTEGMSSGIYFYKLSTKDKTFIKKMILLR